MATFSNNLATETGKNMAVKFYCETCDYKCSKKYNWMLHLSTSKHNRDTNSNILATENGKTGIKIAIYACDNCNKEYNDRSGLWRHKKKCYTQTTTIEKEDMSEKELMMMIIKDNSELKNIILEVVKNGTHNNNNNTTTTTHTNSHNKAFNLNFFLNETCKDAMNIMDFVDSIKIQLSDLERVGELGYVEGISNIIINNLKELDITKRPVHCTDKKRETMYVKDQDKWEKDEEQKTMHKVVRKVACKNQNSLQMFRDAHPDYNKYHSKFSDQYNKLIVESMGGTGNDDLAKEEKIIKKISKEVIVDK